MVGGRFSCDSSSCSNCLSSSLWISNDMWISWKWSFCLRWSLDVFDRCRIGTKDASCSSLLSARCENFMWSLPLSMWVFTMPNIVLILTFSGTNVFFGRTWRADFLAWVPLISLLIRRFSVSMAWLSAVINSLRVTFRCRAIGVRGVSIGSSFSSISILSSSYRFSSFLP